MRRHSLSVVLLVVLAACGGSNPAPPPSPTPPAPTPGGSGPPIVAIEVKADSTGARDAIVGLSEVVVDMSASAGANLTYAIDFGDGFIATTANARHVYAAAGTYTINGTVTSDGRVGAMVTRQIAVREATGSWFHAGYIAKTGFVEVRRLTIDARTGTAVRGTYAVAGEAAQTFTFTGSLIPPRSIRLTTARGVTLEGTLPGRLNDEAEPLALLVHGDSADGERLEFRAITGTPDTA